jgi:hypothetical protein
MRPGWKSRVCFLIGHSGKGGAVVKSRQHKGRVAECLDLPDRLPILSGGNCHGIDPQPCRTSPDTGGMDGSICRCWPAAELKRRPSPPIFLCKNREVQVKSKNHQQGADAEVRHTIIHTSTSKPQSCNTHTRPFSEEPPCPSHRQSVSNIGPLLDRRGVRDRTITIRTEFVLPSRWEAQARNVHHFSLPSGSTPRSCPAYAIPETLLHQIKQQIPSSPPTSSGE